MLRSPASETAATTSTAAPPATRATVLSLPLWSPTVALEGETLGVGDTAGEAEVFGGFGV
jgi:hypothetical protein